MRTLIRRRDVLTSGTLAVAGSVLGTPGSPRLADASEAPGPPAGTESSLGANRTLEALKEAVCWPTPSIAAIVSLAGHPASHALAEVRRQALDRLRVSHQRLNPFKFIVYSEWGGTGLAPVQ